MTRKYGEDRVCQIITFGTMKAKQAVRDVGRALDVSYGETDAIAKAIPFDLGMTIEKALETSPDFKAMYDENPKARSVIEMARALELSLIHIQGPLDCRIDEIRPDKKLR